MSGESILRADELDRMMRAVFFPILALLAVGCVAQPAAAQGVGASHDEGNSSYRYQCNSSAPDVAIIACTNHAITLNPNDAEAFRGRGYTRLGRREVGPAIEDLTAAIALNPKDALAFRFRSSAYTAKKDFKRANMDGATTRPDSPIG